MPSDFYHHFYSLEIRENAIDRLVRLYKDAVYKTGVSKILDNLNNYNLYTKIVFNSYYKRIIYILTFKFRDF